MRQVEIELALGMLVLGDDIFRRLLWTFCTLCAFRGEAGAVLIQALCSLCVYTAALHFILFMAAMACSPADRAMIN